MDIPVSKARRVLKIAQEPISLETPVIDINLKEQNKALVGNPDPARAEDSSR